MATRTPKNPDCAAVHERILARLHADPGLKLSLRKLEDESGIPRGGLSHFFAAGDRTPNAQMLKDIAEALELLAPAPQLEGSLPAHPAEALFGGTSFATILATGDLTASDARCEKLEAQLAIAEARAAAADELQHAVATADARIVELEAHLRDEQTKHVGAALQVGLAQDHVKQLQASITTLKAEKQVLLADKNAAQVQRVAAQAQLQLPAHATALRAANVFTWREYALLLERRNEEITNALADAREQSAANNNTGAIAALSGIVGLTVGAIAGAAAAANDAAPARRRARR